MTRPPLDKETMPDEIWLDGVPKEMRNLCGNFAVSLQRDDCLVRYVRTSSQTVEPMDIEGLKAEVYEAVRSREKNTDEITNFVVRSNIMAAISYLHVTNRLRIGWQDINTAPKNKYIHVYFPAFYDPYILEERKAAMFYGWFSDEGKFISREDSYFAMDESKPTLWYPSPDMPDTKAGGDK